MTKRLPFRPLCNASLAALATVLLWSPQTARAQGYAGTGTVDFGTATIDTATPGVTNINLPVSSPRATITWTPTDTGTGGPPIDFLPNGNVVNYTGDVGASVPYTVLNRIIPNDPTRAVAFNGIVNSNNNVRVFFYSPGGLLIGSTARFNVGGLLLSTSDLVLDGSNDFMPVQDQFSVVGATGSQSAVVINSGAEIRAETVGQSNYVVAIAPRIEQNGLISVRGSTALVAAESAAFAVDNQGLFNITVSQGSEVTTNTFVHGGSTVGPDAAGAGEFRRIYMVAVPKNNAITMAIQSGGNIGFDVAGAANIDGNKIILSAGHNIADSGNGDPTSPSLAGAGSADLVVQRGNFTSNTIAVSMTNATVADNIVGGTPDISFASSLSVRGLSTAEVRADQGIVNVAGDLYVSADAAVGGSAGAATLAAGGAGTQINIGGTTVISASAAPSTNSVGGIATVATTGGNITVANGLYVDANGNGISQPGGGNGGTAIGGQVLANISAGGQINITNGQTSFSARGFAGIGGSNANDAGGDSIGGLVRVSMSGTGSAFNAGGGLLLNASAIGGDAGFIVSGGTGGSATGGTVEIDAIDGSVSGGTGGVLLYASAIGGRGNQGGQATGGIANLYVNNAQVTTNGDFGLSIQTNATGGQSASSAGDGGNAIGGTIEVQTRGATGRIETNIGGGAGGSGLYGIELQATAEGGSATAASSFGGSATGGSVTLSTSGAGQQIINNSAMGTQLDAHAYGQSAGSGVGAGGSGTGGRAIIDIAGGTYNATSGETGLFTNAQSGSGSITGEGNAQGGVAEFRVGPGGNATLSGGLSLASSANAFSGTEGGNGTGGRALLSVNGGTFQSGGGVSFEASGFGGGSTSTSRANGTGGEVSLLASNASTVTVNGDLSLQARGIGGNSIGPFGGDARNGDITVRAVASDVALATSSGNIYFFNDAIAGTGDVPGTTTVRNALIETSAGGRASLGTAITGGTGDITVGGNLLAGANSLNLTLSAQNELTINSAITNAADNSRLALRADNDGNRAGTVAFGGSGSVSLTGTGSEIDIYHNPTTLYSPTDYSSNVTDGTLTAYQLVHDANELQGIASFVNQSFALARDIDVGVLANSYGGAGWLPIGVSGASFTGRFDGLGHSILNLTINRPGQSAVGLFGWADGAVIRNVNLVGGSVTATQFTGALIGVAFSATQIDNAHSNVRVFSDGGDVGGLVGHLAGTLTNSHSSGNVTVINGQFSVGGLVGYSSGSISRSWATGNVLLDGSVRGVGGLVGFNAGSIRQTYATGNVTGQGAMHGAGGLVGYNSSGVVAQSYATGDVTGPDHVGGFVGYLDAGTVSNSYATGNVTSPGNLGGFAGFSQGAVEFSYWDRFTSGQTTAIGQDFGSTINLVSVTSNPADVGSPDYAFSPNSYADFAEGQWVYAGGVTRPIGAWEVPVAANGLITIRSGHQLQFVNNNLGGNYRVGNDIDLTESSRLAGVWGTDGFIPIGSGGNPFTGRFDGAGHVLNGLSLNRTGPSNFGLFESSIGEIRNVGLSNVNINGGAGFVGALIGNNQGLISGSFVTGTVTGGGNVTGGLVGFNSNTGTITNSYSSATVNGANTAGGLAGVNAGAISFSFANGAVSGTNAGGLIGTNATLATATNSYFDNQLSGLANGCGTDDGTNCGAINALNTAQTRQSSSFTGWSIDPVGGQGFTWRIYNGSTTPLLRSFLRPLAVQVGMLTTQYDTTLPVVPVTTPGGDPARIFGTAVTLGATPNVGTYAITYAGGLYSNQMGYDLVASGTPGSLTITPAPLTVTANPFSRAYGDANSPLTFNSSGLLGADTLTGSLDTLANVTSGVGIYAITQGTLNNSNYAITYNGADLTVTQRSLIINADALARIYGDVNPPLTYTIGGSGLVNGDTLTGTLDTLASVTSNVGTYAINLGTLSAGSNYAVSYNGANLNVTPRPITVTGDTLTRTYGDANPALTFAVGGAGLVNGDMLTGALATAATGTTGVGSYAITQGTLAAGSNYALTYFDGLLTIGQRALTITADALSRIYGDNNPALTYTTGGMGLVNGDTLTGALDTTANATSNVGAYAINQGTLDAGGNYIVTYNNADLSVTPRALTVVADAASRIYGDANPAFTYTTTGLVNGDLLSGSLTSTATVTSNVGLYAIDQGTLNNANYTISYTGADLTVTQRSLIINADALGRLYGDANPMLTYTLGGAGLVNGDALTGALDTTATVTSNVGAYAISQGTLAASSNYAVSYNGANVNVTARPITVTGDVLSRVYGDANPALTFSVGGAGLVNGDTLTGALAATATGVSNVGAYAVTQGTLAASANYALAYVDGTLNVTQRSLIITADALSRIYGDANPALTYTVGGAGLVNGNTLSGGLDTVANVTSNVGTYAINQGTLDAGGNYAISFTGANLSVATRALTVVADAASRAYGDVNPALTYTATGLVNGDTLAGALGNAATVTSNVGTYAINQGSLANANYAISYTGADLTITQRSLIISADALGRIYGDANPALTYTIAGAGLVNGDTLTGALDTTAVATSNVGSYAVTQGTLDAGGNYAISYNSANLSVSARPITVTGDVLSRVYGDANPALTFTVGGAGLVNGDTLSGALSTTAVGTSNVGAYGVTQGTLDAGGNYAMTYLAGLLNVTQRALTITADALSRVYGDANPALTYTVGGAGLVNGDAVSGVLATAANGTSNVGTYAINQGTLDAGGNYAVTYTGANLSVTQRALTVVADTASRIYGDANPTFTYTATGLVNGDTLTGGLTTLATTASGVGLYGITQGSLAASANYTIGYTGADLTITQRAITVTGDILSRVYGDANPALTFSVGGLGLVNGDTLSGALATTAAALSNVGAYTVTQGTLAAGGNYALSFVGGTLNVTQRSLIINADALSRIYGDANPALTYTLGGAGLVNGDTLAGGLSTLANATSNVGGYAISQGALAASSNYAVTYNGATLSVTPRALTVTGDILARTYGDANPALTFTAAGLVNGDTLTGALATAANGTSNVGAYAVTQGNLTGGANYTLSFVNGAVNVTQRSLIISADALSRIYGDSNPALTYTVGGAGLVNGDTITGGLATIANTTSNVGNYAIDQGTLAASGNYAVTYNGSNLSVTQRALSVTANAASRIYGDANPAFTYTATGLVNGDVLTGGLTSAAGITFNVGTYGIDQGSLAASANYVLSYTGNTLTVTQRPLTVIANAVSRIYGDANPVLTYAVTGLVNGDALTGALNTTAGAVSNVGSYAIGQGTLSSSANYSLAYNGATLSVTARPIIISADGQTRLVGAANPPLTYSVGGSGLVNGDALNGALTTAANETSPLGTYAIQQGTLAATSNYTISYVGADLVVAACAGGDGCAAPAPVMDAINQIGSDVQEQNSEDEATEEAREEAAAEATADPEVIISNTINTDAINQPVPVNEQVTGAGNSSNWSSGDPK